MASRFAQQGRPEASAILEVLRGKVNMEFRRNCRILVRDNGPVSIQVRHPGLVYTMRQRWLGTVMEAISTQVPKLAGRRIVFEHGAAGLSFGES